MSLVLNKVFNQHVSEFIVQMFKPQWSPTEDQADLVEVANKDQGVVTNFLFDGEAPHNVSNEQRKHYSAFRTFYFPSNLRGNAFPARESAYHEKNYIFAGALINEAFLNMMNIINSGLRNGIIPEYFYLKPETYDPANGTFSVALGEVIKDETGLLEIDDFAVGCTMIKDFEEAVLNDAAGAYIDSQSVPELLIRLLFSIEADNRYFTNYKRELAKKMLLKLGISATVINDAFKCFFAFTEYNTTNITTNFTDDGKLEIIYDKPIKLENKYVKSIHNANNQQLYLFFPFINSAIITDYAPKIFYQNNAPYVGTIGAMGVSGDFFTGAASPVSVSFKEIRATNMPTLTDKFQVDTVGKQVLTVPYTALTIGQVGTGSGSGTSSTTVYDLEFDHIDKIDYLDGYKISIQTPYVIG